MDCAEIEKRLLANESVTGADVDAHLAGCESCRFLVGDGAQLPQALASAVATGPADMAILEARVFDDLTADRGWLGRLRAQPRAVRMVPLVALVAIEALFMYGYLRRADWASYPAWRMALIAGGYAVIAVALAWQALRPLYLRAVPDATEKLILGIALGLPFVVAVLPGPPMMIDIPGFTYPGYGFRCFAYGCLLALAVILLARGLDRAGGRTAFLAALAGGYAGLLGLQLECPINDPLHILTGHAVIPLALLAGAWLFRRA